MTGSVNTKRTLALFTVVATVVASIGLGLRVAQADTAAIGCPGSGGVGTPTVTQATQVQQITGALSNPYHMNGADLGVAWASGNAVLHVFGDNGSSVQPQFSGPILSGYQPNAIGFDSSSSISAGIRWTGITRPILPLFTSSEDGVVPTGGVHVNGKDYLKYVVFAHNHTSQAQTTANGIAESDDGGHTWHRVYSAIWPQNSSDTDNFQQQALVAGPDGYVYAFSTQSDRLGNVYLMRVPNASILYKSAYQYWTGSSWSSSQGAATPLVAGPAGEMSAAYISGKWIMMYNNDHDTDQGATVLRYASSPTGPWSAPQTVLPDSVRTIYAPMIDPRSTGTDLYFYGSDWSTYQTYLFHSTMSLP